jgi:hypothetical protein
MMRGFCLLSFYALINGFSFNVSCAPEEKADLEKALQQIAEPSSESDNSKPVSSQTAASNSNTPPHVRPSSSDALKKSDGKSDSHPPREKASSETQSASLNPPADSDTPAHVPNIVLPDDPKAFMEIVDRSELSFSFPQENTDTLILKVNSGMILIRQKGTTFKVQVVGKDLQKTNVRAFKSRNGKALIVDSTVSSAAAKKQRLDYMITIPENVNLQCMGGRIDLKLEGLKGTYVTLDCGQLILRSMGSVLSGFKGTAGEANIWIDGILNQFLLACASGNIQVKYLTSKQPPAEGLTFARKPMISIRQALGRAVFVFPEEMKVTYKSSSSVRSSFPSEKNPDLKCVFYVSDLVDIQLIKNTSPSN